jgi:DHA1 family tetracycline resistance protein-like MFS transporter
MEKTPTTSSPTSAPIARPAAKPPILAHALIFSIILLDVMGITILFPVSTFIVRQYSQEALMVVLLNVLYSAAQFLAAPVLGQLSDHVGRRPVLLVCLGGSMIGYLMFGFGDALWILFLSRVIAGITGGSISTASAYIADKTEAEERVEAMSLVGMAWGVGLVVGPAMGGILGQIGLRAPAFGAAAFSMVNIVLGYFMLHESLPKELRKKTPMRGNDFNALASIGDMGRIPGLGVLFLAICLFNFAFNSMSSTESLFFIQKFAIQPWQNGLLTVLAGVGVVFSQVIVIQRLAPRFSTRAIAVISLLLMTLGALAVCFAPILVFIYPIITLRSVISNLVFTTLGALSANAVSASELGILMGVTTALNSLMGIFGPILAGLLYDHVHHATPYLMAAVFFALAAFLLNSWTAPQTRAALERARVG